VVFDYIDGGADAELTLRDNCGAFEDVTLRPRSAVATPVCDLRTSVLGTSLSMPFLLAPIGSTRMFYPRGEEHAARAAGAAGTGYILSTFSGCRLEDVKRASTGPVWLQLYLVGDRGATNAMLDRARGAGYSALVVTIDTPVAGNRERDVRNGSKALVTQDLFPMIPYIWQFLARPRWLAAFLADGGMMKFPNIVLPGGSVMLYEDVAAALEKSVVTWKDLAWIRELWNGPIVVKGVHTAEDALRAVEAGANAIVVSNHGGRQLDSVQAPITVLPEVVDAVGGRVPVLVDGGFRRGTDVFKALALGAGAVMVARPTCWGLAAAGEDGVADVLRILRSELENTMVLAGTRSVADITGAHVSRA
jgi:L-lactate dehydrogenase (cytochrome)